ncbi:MAG: hypothetical protein ACREE5_08570 [Acetobacteraceae bacterium]
MALNFALDRHIHQPGHFSPILVELDLPATNILHEARPGSASTRLGEQTAEARTRGIFGPPTFFVEKEMFRGDDPPTTLFSSARNISPPPAERKPARIALLQRREYSFRAK